MSDLALILSAFGAIGLGRVFVIARAHHRRRRLNLGPRPRGTAPGAGVQLVNSPFFDTHHSAWRVPKDPQAYARAFVPPDRD